MTRDELNALRSRLVAEDRTLQAEIKALEDTTPNQRDYWPHLDTWRADLAAHRAKGETLRQRRAALVAEFNAARLTVTND